MDERQVLASLPPHLRVEAVVFLQGDALSTAPFLRHLDASLLHSLAVEMQPRLFSPRTLVYARGHVGAALFVVDRGLCGTCDHGGVLLQLLKRGELFGELALFGERHVRDVSF
jgi:CRP-like cAMP-binding protein